MHNNSTHLFIMSTGHQITGTPIDYYGEPIDDRALFRIYGDGRPVSLQTPHGLITVSLAHCVSLRRLV